MAVCVLKTTYLPPEAVASLDTVAQPDFFATSASKFDVAA